MMNLLHPWILQAALQGCIPGIPYAQITQFLTNPTPTDPTELVLSDKTHCTKTIFTVECLNDLRRKGVLSIGSLRGGLVQVQEGTILPTHDVTRFELVVNRVHRVGLDDCCTFGMPMWLETDPAAIEYLANLKNPWKATAVHHHTSDDSSYVDCSALIAMGDLVSQELRTINEPRRKEDTSQLLSWEDCIIPDDQQKLLDAIWRDPTSDNMSDDPPVLKYKDTTTTTTTITTNTTTTATDDNTPISTSQAPVHSSDSGGESSYVAADFYENVPDMDLELDAVETSHKTRINSTQYETQAQSNTPPSPKFSQAYPFFHTQLPSQEAQETQDYQSYHQEPEEEQDFEYFQDSQQSQQDRPSQDSKNSKSSQASQHSQSSQNAQSSFQNSQHHPPSQDSYESEESDPRESQQSQNSPLPTKHDPPPPTSVPPSQRRKLNSEVPPLGGSAVNLKSNPIEEPIPMMWLPKSMKLPGWNTNGKHIF